MSSGYHRKLISKGEKASRDYHEILNLPTTQIIQKAKTASPRKLRVRKDAKLTQFDKDVLFRAALSDDVKSVSSMHFTGNDVNSCDAFGWSGLMIAACEGSRKVCEFLLNKDCDLTIADRSGNTALSLAKTKNRTEVVSLIEEKMSNAPAVIDVCSSNTPVQRVKHEPFWCEECQLTFKETSRKSHESSTLHRFNRKNAFEFSRRYFIPDSNIGFKMMLRQGWDRESGLGPNSEGKLFPVKTTIRKARSGLGVKQDSARVTHYSAFDRDAIKWRPPAPRAKTKKQLEKDSKKNQRKEIALRHALS